ncbi:MAG TPA: hypothetical protein VLG27_04585 [Candidatus Saccharimonadia bacterium]|nr:hypothetical protein [Candidatus Saccharimonadia bacterium]
MRLIGRKEQVAQTPEASPFASVSDPELIARFYESGADPAIGRELSVRLLAHARYKGDPTTEPLTHKSGTPVLDEATGQPLTLADYVPYAADHHLWALEQILSFLYTSPGEPEYEDGRAAYAHYTNPSSSRQPG